MGGITLASDGDTLVGLWFDGQRHFGESLADGCVERANLTVFGDTKRWLDIYFSGKVPDFTPPLTLRGTAFRRSVWSLLLTIPFGQVVTYGDIACELTSRHGHRRVSARAVGTAVAHNGIMLIVPCHRVVASDGALTGYAAGIDIKRSLLALEHSAG